MSHDVFISHSARDKATADAICAGLESSGIRCWIAPRDVLPSTTWAESILAGIAAARMFVVVVSAQSSASPQVLREVDYAVKAGIAVLPFRIDSCAPSAALEFYLGTPHWLDALSPPMEAHIRRLEQSVRALLASRTGEAAAQRAEPASRAAGAVAGPGVPPDRIEKRRVGADPACSGMVGAAVQGARAPAAPGDIAATVRRADREQLITLPDLVKERMRAADFGDEAVEACIVSLGEAINNAFDHGCDSDTDVVAVYVRVDPSYATFTVVNPEGKPFDLVRAMERARERLARDSRSRRGRGLLFMHELVDRMTSVEDGRGVKGVVERSRVEFLVTHVEDVAVATLTSGIQNASFSRRSIAVVESEAARNVLLDFSNYSTGGTSIYMVAFDAERALARTGKRVAALLCPRHGQLMSPVTAAPEIVAYEVATAVAKLGRPDLEDRISAVVKSARRKP